MLQLRAPIQLVTNPDLCNATEAFSERIIGNYRQIGSFLGEADLLHLVTEPPEIFVMDGGMTSLFSSANVENTQILKTQVINNLINRIILSADAQMSYQDNVYVTNILHKLGVRDERTFLTEAARLFQMTKEQHEAVSLYWSNLETLREMVSSYSRERVEERTSEEEAETQPVLHLHNEVNKRLQSAAIYRILNNFFSNGESRRTLTNEQLRISEQSRLSREMLLQRLRQEVRHEPAYLMYRHENIYEGDEVSEETLTMEQVSSRITSAVLLSMVDNIYDATYERLDRHLHNWLSTEATYYGAAENTLFRIEQNTAYLQYLYEQTKKEGDDNSEYRQEISILRQLMSLWQDLDVRVQQSIGGDAYETEVEQLTRLGDVTEENFFAADEAADMVHITREGDTTEVTEVDSHTDALTQEVLETYQQSIYRNQRYMNSLKTILEQNAVASTGETAMQRMQRESRLSLEHPGEFMEQYEAAESRERERVETIIRESERLLSPQQQRAHELIREYLQSPERFYHSEVISENNLGLMLYDIREAERQVYGTAQSRAAEAAAEMPSGTDREEAPGEEGFGTGGSGEGAGGFMGAERILETGERIEREFTDFRERTTGVTNENLVFRREGEILSSITERVIERWTERRERSSGPAVTFEDTRMSMVHKNRETVIDEEVIENMQEQIRQLSETRRTTAENVTNQETVINTVRQNLTEEVIEQNNEAITRIVNANVRRQIDEISDRVYGKIERQLQNERRRRGM